MSATTSPSGPGSGPPAVSRRRHPLGHEHAAGLDTTLDFLNTFEHEDGFPVEHLPTFEAALDWLRAHGVVHDLAPFRGSARAAAASLGRVRAARAALREVADSVAESRPAPVAAIGVVNELLRNRELVELVPVDGGLAVGHRHVGDPLDNALARLALPLVDVIATGQAERLRVCANDLCRWVFFDSSRTGRRRWCDMATCGNRAKAARHRARLRARLPAGRTPTGHVPVGQATAGEAPAGGPIA